MPVKWIVQHKERYRTGVSMSFEPDASGLSDFIDLCEPEIRGNELIGKLDSAQWGCAMDCSVAERLNRNGGICHIQWD